MSFDDLLDLPIKRFWFLVNQVDRLRAEQDIRQTHILAAVNSQDSLTTALRSLGDELGRVYTWNELPAQEIKLRVDPVTGLDPEFDREGLHALRALM